MSRGGRGFRLSKGCFVGKLPFTLVIAWFFVTLDTCCFKSWIFYYFDKIILFIIVIILFVCLSVRQWFWVCNSFFYGIFYGIIDIFPRISILKNIRLKKVLFTTRAERLGWQIGYYLWFYFNNRGILSVIWSYTWFSLSENQF